MILVDTPVWIDHLRLADAQLSTLLNDGQVLGHPHVTGELALGNLQNRDGVLSALEGLPKARMAMDVEVLRLISSQRLFSYGIGYINAHLLAATMLTGGAAIWTRDRRLQVAASKMGLSMASPH